MKLRGIAIVLPVAVALLLAGCSTPAPAATSAPSSTPTSTGAATATPAPTPTASVLPTVRIPLHCADLFTQTTLSTDLGTKVSLKRTESSQPRDLDEAADRQYGTLECVWGGKTMTDSGYDQTLDLSVAPDSADAYADNITALKKFEAMKLAVSIGDGGALGCETYNTGADSDRIMYCNSTMLVGTSWVTARVQGNGPKTLTTAVANARVEKMLTTIAGSLAGVTTSPAWTPPAGSPLAFCSSPDATAAVRTAFAAPKLQKTKPDEASPFDAGTISQGKGVYSYCGWQLSPPGVSGTGTVTNIGVTTLAGGGWLIPQLVAAPPTQWYVGQYKAVDIAGAGRGIEACNNADCNAMMQIAGSAVSISFDDLGASRNRAYLAALVKAIGS